MNKPSHIIALCITQFMSFAAGYVFSGFTMVLEAESPFFPIICVGMVALNCMAMMQFIWAREEDEEPYRGRLARVRRR